MDGDVIFGIFLILFFLVLLTSPLSITACIAAAATRRWSKEKARRAQNGPESAEEADGLISDGSDAEDEDFLDSEDEAYYRAKQEQKHRERQEEKADWELSTKSKFVKEWKKCWTGPAGSKEELAKKRELLEQDERRKIAREAVREYLRIERKKARKAQSTEKGQEAGMELPTYGIAVAEGKR